MELFNKHFLIIFFLLMGALSSCCRFLWVLLKAWKRFIKRTFPKTLPMVKAPFRCFWSVSKNRSFKRVIKSSSRKTSSSFLSLIKWASYFAFYSSSTQWEMLKYFFSSPVISGSSMLMFSSSQIFSRACILRICSSSWTYKSWTKFS